MFINPDAPVPGDFTMSTYAPYEKAVAESWYNGMPTETINPFDKSRRYQTNAYVTQGYATPLSYQQVPQPYVPQQDDSLQPYASYPPSAPATPQQYGFNQLADSRRNNNATANTGTNPWAASTVQQPMMQPQQPLYPQQGFNNMPQGDPYYGLAPVFPPATQPIATPTQSQNIPAGCNKYWDNPYTAQKPIQPMAVDWNDIARQQQQLQQPQMQDQFINNVMPNQFPKSEVNWREIAERNWANL